MLKTSSTPVGDPNVLSNNCGLRLRSFGRLRFLAIPLACVAMAPMAQRAEVVETGVSSAPALAAAPAAVAEMADMAEAVAAPVLDAVATPAAQAEPVAANFAVPAVLNEKAQGMSPKVLAAALDAVSCAQSRGVSGRNDLLTIIDYSLPSTEKRLWVLDLQKGEVLFHELVAHGAGTGEKYATRFSNVMDSRQTSLGLFLTGGTYEGGNGYSMKLRGLDRGINDRAEERHIVMHGAWYVNPEHARRQGRIGRSWGCPALSQEIAPTVIDTIKGGSFVYSYHGQASVASSCGSRSAGAPMVAAAP
ncbi:MAG TPA: murein L,D-transpeptidase catalytic domain family protein [Thermoanaerobaculia bacterium]|nr:murein L,D-transpeptidase catalytic domain family protein [Thermoanaerobaculia bacterium]